MIKQTRENAYRTDQMVTNKPFSHVQSMKPRKIKMGSKRYMIKMVGLLQQAEELFLNTTSYHSNKLNLVRTVYERNLVIINKLRENIRDLHNVWDMNHKNKFSGLRKNLSDSQTKDNRFQVNKNICTESCHQLDDIKDTQIESLVQGIPTTLELNANALENNKSSTCASKELDKLVSKIRNQYCDSSSSTHSSSLQTLRDENCYEKTIEELFPQPDVLNKDYSNDLLNETTSDNLTSVIKQDVMLNEVTGYFEPVTDQKITSLSQESISNINEFRTVVVATSNEYLKTNNTLFGFDQTNFRLTLNGVTVDPELCF